MKNKINAETKEFNRIKRKTEKIIKDHKYDCIETTYIEIQILTSIGMAEKHGDLSPSIYNVTDYILNGIRNKMNKVKFIYKEDD